MKLKLNFIISLFGILSLTGCGINETPEEKYASINDALNQTYSSFTIENVTVEQNISLTSTYVFSLNDDTYTVFCQEEKLNEISLDGDMSQKRIEQETKTIEASKVNFDKFEVSEAKYTIKVYFDNYLEGTITNPQNFLNVTTEVTDFVIKIEFGTKLTKIEYSYSTPSYTNYVTYKDFK